MKLPEIDLVLEHAGHEVKLTGSGPEYCARFPSLWSAVHYGITLWSFRRQAPKGLAIRLEWRRFSYLVRS